MTQKQNLSSYEKPICNDKPEVYSWMDAFRPTHGETPLE